MELCSLIAVPRNLKEGIDWLMALRGTDDENGLKAVSAVLYEFLAQQPVGLKRLRDLEDVKSVSHEFLLQPEFQDQPYVKDLVQRYTTPMNKDVGTFAKAFGDIAKSDYENVLQTQGVNPETIEEKLRKVVHGTEKFLNYIKNTRRYSRTYGSAATWASSCTHDPELCAAILVGMAPMLYAGLRYLNDAAADAFLEGPDSVEEKRLVSVLEALGYEGQQKRGKMRSSDIRNALSGVDKDVLTVLYDLAGFWAFY
ncbi:hypothetical protein, conserved [Babesia ovata]|uniref:Uncharacterized protein n=1 Tax=Babesia ovata TaxID=189622 RepID=A0A2H6KDD4_9APIC|nr:uncharacterized protein BOVATA_025030 [Babesia ovata]GBE61010.1 hypothetical protein, conserved [Babesia ovata]